MFMQSVHYGDRIIRVKVRFGKDQKTRNSRHRSDKRKTERGVINLVFGFVGRNPSVM